MSDLFYRPVSAVAGDVIPFFDQGVFKPFYLRNFRGNRDETHKDGWVMLTTRDHVHFQETDTGIRGGTGSVIKVQDEYHLFYCTFQQQPERNWIQHAVSRDLLMWTTLSEEAFASDDHIYGAVHFRDPYVFFHEKEQCWWMLVAAQRKGPTTRQACVGLCKSEDLHHWRYCEPLYAPAEAQGAFECPELFQWGDWYYLVYSSYADRFQTLYRMSRTPEGPWLRPPVDSFDARAFYAAKSVSDGQRRYLYGWNPTRQGNEHQFDPQTDCGMDWKTWDWGGNLVVHELKQQQDGTLTVDIPQSVAQAVAQPVALTPEALSKGWTLAPEQFTANARYTYEALLAWPLPDCCRVETEIRYEGPAACFGVALQVDKTFAKGYYLLLEPPRQRLEFRSSARMTEEGGQKFPYEVELERPLALRPGKNIHLTLLREKSILEVYVDGQVALSARMDKQPGDGFGLFAQQGTVRFTNTRLFTRTTF